MRTIPKGDSDPQIIFAAVGYALTEWEKAETSLSALFTVLDRNPGDLSIYQKYGSEGRIFRARLQLLKHAGFKYFAIYSCQDNEGELAEILTSAAGLSETRNRIAHGIMEPIIHVGYANMGENDEGDPDFTTRYHLNTPWYSQTVLNAEWPGLGAEEIAALSENFQLLATRVDDFCQRLLEQNA